MSQSSIEPCRVSSATQRIHAFLKLGICVKRKDVMFLLLLRSVGRVICQGFSSRIAASWRC